MKSVQRQPLSRRKLSPEEVYDLRVASLQGAPHVLLADEYGVHQSTVTRAVNGDTYARVPHPVEMDLPAGSPMARFGPQYYPYSIAVEKLASVGRDVIHVTRQSTRRITVRQMLNAFTELERLQDEDRERRIAGIQRRVRRSVTDMLGHLDDTMTPSDTLLA